MSNQVTQEVLRELLHYDPETGVFKWKTRPKNLFTTEHRCNNWNSRYSGKIAGCNEKSHHGITYTRIRVGRNLYQSHRLAWLYVYGEWPDTIDHQNGIGTDNRISNLRNVTVQENNKNLRKRATNSSGVTGVYWNKAASKWHAQITVDRKVKFLGYFHSLDKAKEARRVAQQQFGFHENHGEGVTA